MLSISHHQYSNPTLEGVAQNQQEYKNNGKELMNVHYSLGTESNPYIKADSRIS